MSTQPTRRSLRDALGGLSTEKRQLVTDLYRQPSSSTWARARAVVVSPVPLITLEMAVRQVAVGPIHSPPDPFTLRRALYYASDLHEQYLRMLSEC
jgi:hypothetical protein